ncbi:MAG: hypothetical protein K2N34_02015 [Lachnospiraceae bacterium]|nr:hypothetical protein [Lachnospiraceae bacterium]
MGWKKYSDSIAQNATISDSVLVDIIRSNGINSTIDGRKAKGAKYNVIRQKIKVDRYKVDADTAKVRLSFGDPHFLLEQSGADYITDSVTPPLPGSGLYLTSEIYKKLASFAGGLKDGDGFGEINKKNVKRLKKYIPVDYGHWGGYWWFTTFPIITGICYANNLIAVERRTSWCTGDVLWYVKENGKFILHPELTTRWIE